MCAKAVMDADAFLWPGPPMCPYLETYDTTEPGKGVLTCKVGRNPGAQCVKDGTTLEDRILYSMGGEPDEGCQLIIPKKLIPVV